MQWSVVIDSQRFGYKRGTVTDLDDALRKLPKERVARRCVAVLNALAGDRTRGFSTVNNLLAAGLPEPEKGKLLSALAEPDSVFFEPLQQLVVLRRALAVCPDEGEVALESDEGIRLYLTASRMAIDVIPSPSSMGTGKKTQDWLEVAAGLMTRMWITHPVHPTLSIARSIEILEKLPNARPELAESAQRLKTALASGLDVSYEEATILVRFLSIWSLRLKPQDIFANPNAAAFDPRQWTEKMNMSTDAVQNFLQRTARDLSDPLDDTLPGATIGIIPFRDKPLLRFSDGTVAPIYPELLIEKLTPALFWWSTSPGEQQHHHWRSDWGVLAEAYVSMVLSRIAEMTGCTFRPDLKREGEWQVDGVVWSPDARVSLVEVSAGALRDAAAADGNAAALQAGLRWTYVESTKKGKPKSEGVQQLARDVSLLADGTLQQMDVPSPSRVHPLLVVFDRRLQTPGVWFYLDDEFTTALSTPPPWDVAPLAVVTIEELEAIEALAEAGKLGGAPPGLLKLLRLWEATWRKEHAWWRCMNRYWPNPPDNQRLKQTGDEWARSIGDWFV